jgi:hypothetical protein
LLDIINNNDRLLVTKAYRLTGLSVKLDFDPKVLDSLKQKYPNGGSINIGGDKGVKLELNYLSNSAVTLKVPSDVYIAGEFSKLTTNGTINLGDKSTVSFNLTPVKILPGEKIGQFEGIEKTQIAQH